MKTLSLYAKLRNLSDIGVLNLRYNPEMYHIFKGEGSYYYGDNPVQIVPDVVGRGPEGQFFTEPHDVAWVPATKTFLAASPSKVEPFEPIPQRLRSLLSKFRSKYSN